MAQRLLSQALSANSGVREDFQVLCKRLGGPEIAKADFNMIVGNIVLSVQPRAPRFDIAQFGQRFQGVAAGVGGLSQEQAAVIVRALDRHPNAELLAKTLGTRLSAHLPELLDAVLDSPLTNEARHQMTRGLTSGWPFTDRRDGGQVALGNCRAAMAGIANSGMNHEHVAELAENLGKGLFSDATTRDIPPATYGDFLVDMLRSVGRHTTLNAQAAAQGLSVSLGGPDMHPGYIPYFLKAILRSPPNTAMFAGLCRGLGGSQMKPACVRALANAIRDERNLNSDSRQALLKELPTSAAASGS